jgi:putative DNA primase/helicase
LWRWKWNWAKDKWDKPPFQAHSPDRYASNTDPSTWASYQVALAAYQLGGVDGVSVALTGDAAPDVIAFDLDKCRDPETGALKAWAMHIIVRAHELKAYVEVSASGTGLHIFGRSDREQVHKEKYPVPGSATGEGIEVFHRSNGHFLSITGNQVGESSDPLPDLTKFFDEVTESWVSLESARVRATGNDTSPSAVFHRFVWSSASRGRTYDEVLEDVREHPDNIGERYEEQNRLEEEVKRSYDKWQRTSAPARATASLPVIRVAGGQIANMIDAAEDSLVEANVPMFVRAGKLVFPTIAEYPAADDTKTIAVVLRPGRVENIVYELNRCATFIKYDARSRSWVTVDPPDKVAEGLLHKGQWKLPKVVGVTTVPTMRPDGTILDTPGYDEATQLWYEPDPHLSIPRIGETEEEAQAALQKLDGLLPGFPFVASLDRSVALATLIGPVVRGAFDVGPGCHTRAHEVAQGKSFLANLTSVIVTGKPCPVAPYVEDEREVEKTLDALILAGVPIVSIDNCTHDVGGARLCQMVEQQVVFVRILGKSEVPPCEWRGTLLTNGNNVDVVGDYTRRSLQINLDAGVESDQVHLRKFKFDPIQLVLKDRGAYVAAALTVARAFRATGAQVDCAPIASYGRWSRAVREPLIWLGREDVVKSINLTRQEDPVRAETRSLYDQWQKCFGFKTPHTAAELVEKLTEFVEGRDGEGRYFRNPAYPELLELLSTKVDKRGNVSALIVGHWLRAVEGQVHGGRKLTRVAARATGGGVQYILTEVGSQVGLVG